VTATVNLGNGSVQLPSGTNFRLTVIAKARCPMLVASTVNHQSQANVKHISQFSCSLCVFRRTNNESNCKTESFWSGYRSLSLLTECVNNFRANHWIFSFTVRNGGYLLSVLIAWCTNSLKKRCRLNFLLRQQVPNVLTFFFSVPLYTFSSN
jgi:hypothetical protein